MQVDEKIRILTRLIALIQVLQDRFESRVSTNHVKAALFAHLELLKGETLTVTKIAKLSGVPISTISSLLQSIPYIVTQDNPDDDRSKLVTVDNIFARTQYLIDVDAIWRHSTS